MSDVMWVGVVAASMFGGVIMIAVVAKLREVRAAARWTSTPGRVVTSKVQARRKRGDDSGDVGNYPLVQYEYDVAGKQYTGRRIGIGEEAADSDVAPILARYPVGSGVLVYYDPKDPNKAVLERHIPPGMGLGLTILLLFLVGGPIGAALAYTVIVPKLAPHLPNPDRAPFVVALTGMGLFVVMIGLALRKQARASRRWPTTEGLVLTSKVEAHESRTKNGATITLYCPNIVYAYEVSGHRYAESRVGFSGITGTSNRTWAEKIVNRYPEGVNVPVYYDPQNHAEALLEHNTGANLLVWIIAGVLFTGAYFVATRG